MTNPAYDNPPRAELSALAIINGMIGGAACWAIIIFFVQFLYG